MSRATLDGGILVTAGVLGEVLNAALGWWWLTPLAGTCWFSMPPTKRVRPFAPD